MKNLKKEIKRIKNLYSYNGNLTLLESIKVNETPSKPLEIDEKVAGMNVATKIGKSRSLASSGLQPAFRELETAMNLNRNPIKVGNLSLKTADDVFNAIKNGSLVGKELGRVEKSLLRATSTPMELRKAIIVDFVQDTAVLKELSKNTKNVTEIKTYLRNKNYHPNSIDEIVKQMRRNGSIDSKGILNIKGKTTTPPPLPPKPPGFMDNLTNMLRKGTTWKNLAAWAIGLGVGGYALWYFLKESGETIPPDTPPEPPTDSGGGTVLPKRVTYRNCTNFPYTFGCRSEIIREVQKCLGMESKYQTGNFGPITLRNLKSKRGEDTITKEVYNSIKSACGGSGTAPTPVTEPTPVRDNVPIEMIPSLEPQQVSTTSSTEPQIKPRPQQPTETPDELYNRLVREKLIRGRNQNNRLVYKGPDLSDEDTKKLTQSMSEKGFRLSRDNEDYRAGDKIIYKRD
jgi:hypothetical protein